MLSPIDRTELLARMRRLGANPAEVDDDVISFRDLELNTATYQAAVAGRTAGPDIYGIRIAAVLCRERGEGLEP